MEKNYSSKALLKMVGGGMHPPHSPLDPPLGGARSLMQYLLNAVFQLRGDAIPPESNTIPHKTF